MLARHSSRQSFASACRSLFPGHHPARVKRPAVPADQACHHRLMQAPVVPRGRKRCAAAAILISIVFADSCRISGRNSAMAALHHSFSMVFPSSCSHYRGRAVGLGLADGRTLHRQLARMRLYAVCDVTRLLAGDGSGRWKRWKTCGRVHVCGAQDRVHAGEGCFTSELTTVWTSRTDPA